jgi:hypothetical protein
VLRATMLEKVLEVKEWAIHLLKMQQQGISNNRNNASLPNTGRSMFSFPAEALQQFYEFAGSKIGSPVENPYEIYAASINLDTSVNVDDGSIATSGFSKLFSRLKCALRTNKDATMCFRL